MSSYLLDTNVISKFAPERPMPAPELITWMHEQGAADALFLSVMTIAEIQKGIRGLQRRGSNEKSARLQQWLQGIISSFDDRILPMTTTVALVAGDIEAEAASSGRHPGLGDIIIAATANVYDLTVVTENVRHFEALGINFSRPEGSI